MQTFLPYPEFDETARVLDSRRLGKQLVEGAQIMTVLVQNTTGYANHPAVRMWQGHTLSLALYIDKLHTEWLVRGYKNPHGSWVRSIELIIEEHRARYGPVASLPMLTRDVYHITHPDWLGTEELHASHRANLLRKDPEHYEQFGWTEEPAEGYWWPVT